jgi:hypothetical protein
MSENVRRTNTNNETFRTCKKPECKEFNPQPIEHFKLVRKGRWRSRTCKSCEKEWFKQWYIDNKDHILMLSKLYYENNNDKVKERHKQWHIDNKDKFKTYCRQYWQINKGKRRQKCRKYQASLLQRTPLWLTEDQLNDLNMFYMNCPYGYEVDHIVPLQGKNVSGLHVPWNLQYLTPHDNRSKMNKY